MAISNYTELKTAITSWMNRGTVLDANRDDFIALAESRIVRELKTSELEVTTTLTVDANSKALPNNFSSMVYIELNGDYPTLSYFTPDEINSRYASSVTGRPTAYSTQGNTIYFYPLPDATYTATYTYIAKPDIATDTTNRLLTIYPDLYLFACLVEAASFDEDDAKYGKYEARYQQALQSALDSDDDKGILSAFTGAP